MIIRIYTLASSSSPEEIRYIGKTNQTLKRRLQGHLCDAKKAKINNYTKNHNWNWISKQLEEGNTIIINEVDSMEFSENENWKWLEQYWISQFKCWGFNLTNLTDGGDGNQNQHFSKETIELRASKIRGIPRSEETKEKISQGLTGIVRSEETKQKVRDSIVEIQGRRVKQYSKEGVYIKTWDYIKQASNELNIDASNISSCCYYKKNHNTAGGFIWRFENDDTPITVDKSKYINQYDIHGNFIKEWENMNKASKELGIDVSSIYNVVNHKLKHTRRFVFLSINEDMENYKFPEGNLRGSRSIELIDELGNRVASYKSCTEAANDLNLDRKKIAKCCKGEIPEYKGHRFRYID